MKRMDPYEDEKNESTKYPSFCRDISGKQNIYCKQTMTNFAHQYVFIMMLKNIMIKKKKISELGRAAIRT